MHHAHLARSVLLDASPFRRFTDAGLLAELMAYLPNASIVAEVGRELDYAANSRKNAALAGAIANFEWPNRIPGISGPTQLAEAAILRRILKKIAPNKSHEGEVATIIRAKQLDVDLVIMDDKEARRRGARPRHVNTITTATLAAEMTYRGALTDEQGWRAFEISAKGVTYTAFEGALGRAAEPPTPY